MLAALEPLSAVFVLLSQVLSNSEKVRSEGSFCHPCLRNNSTSWRYWGSLTTGKNPIWLFHTEFHIFPDLRWKKHNSVRFLMLYFTFLSTSYNYWSFSWSFSTNLTIRSPHAYLVTVCLSQEDNTAHLVQNLIQELIRQFSSSPTVCCQ